MDEFISPGFFGLIVATGGGAFNGRARKVPDPSIGYHSRWYLGRWPTIDGCSCGAALPHPYRITTQQPSGGGWNIYMCISGSP